MPQLEYSLHKRLIAKLNGKRVELPHITNEVVIKLNKGFIQLRTNRGYFYFSTSIKDNF